MNTDELIGQRITNIFVWSKLEPYGLDEAEVFIQLGNGMIVHVPFFLGDEDLEINIDKQVISVFADLSVIVTHHINPESKPIEQVLEARKRSASSLLGRIKKLFGLEAGVPKEYQPYKTEFTENKIKYLKNRVIVDVLMFANSHDKVFLELDNGYILTETTMSPHGTGRAGLNYYDSLQELEAQCGTEYERLRER